MLLQNKTFFTSFSKTPVLRLFSEVSLETFSQSRDLSTVQRLFYGVENFLLCRDFSAVWRLSVQRLSTELRPFYGEETFSAEPFYIVETFRRCGAQRTSDRKLDRDISATYWVWTLFTIGYQVKSLIFYPFDQRVLQNVVD